MMCGTQPESGSSSGCTGRWLDWNTVGWALVGRGELGLIIAATAREESLIDDEVFAITVWALLISTLVSPLVFSVFLRRRRIRAEMSGEDPREAELPIASKADA